MALPSGATLQKLDRKAINKSYYEKRGGIEVCIDNEIPFEIPENWSWCRGYSIMNQMSSTKPQGDKFRYIDIESINNNAHIIECPKILPTFNAPSRASRYIKAGDTLFSMVRPYLENIAFVDSEHSDCIASTGFFVCSPNMALDPKYLFNLMISKYVVMGLNANMKGDNSPSINNENISFYFYPIPPLSEQTRIVESIEQAFALIDSIEVDKSDLHKAIKQAKAKVLNLAIRGKLVPQDPNDEPASVLLGRIKAEKLTAVKGSKRQQKQPAVTSDNSHYENIPFEIPDSWEWTTLGDVGTWQSGATPSRLRKDYYCGNIPWLKTGDLNDGGINTIPESISESAVRETSVKLNPIGSVLIAMYGATIGKLGILNIPATTNQACCACSNFQGIFNTYLFYFLLANRQKFIQMGGGGAQPNISKEKIVSTILPIPPYTEQIRIVERIENIYNLLNIIEKSLL